MCSRHILAWWQFSTRRKMLQKSLKSNQVRRGTELVSVWKWQFYKYASFCFEWNYFVGNAYCVWLIHFPVHAYYIAAVNLRGIFFSYFLLGCSMPHVCSLRASRENKNWQSLTSLTLWNRLWWTMGQTNYLLPADW